MTIVLQPMIPLKTYRFYFNTESAIRLPSYAGSAWRGALGHALKKTVCVVRNQPCNQCLLKNACAYSIVFETPPPSHTEKMRKYTAAPHPFVIKFLPNMDKSATDYQFDLILLGHGQRYLPYLVHAFKTAGLLGIGGHRQVFKLQKVDDINQYGLATVLYENEELKRQLPIECIQLPTLPKKIKLSFDSPLRLTQDNKKIDFKNKQLEWFDWTRYSSRQAAEINMGGLVGTVELNMRGLNVFWPYLWLGQWTHVGKGTSMGMGAYTIESLDASA